MRVLMQVSIPVEAGNHAARTGGFGEPMGKAVAALNPEAVYFMANADGERCGLVVFDLKDAADIPGLAEPFFLMFKARVTVMPVVTPQDLAKGMPGIEKAVKEYGKAASA